MTFVVRPKARRDIHDIADYIAADNLEASDRFIDEVYRAFELLSKMPHMGLYQRSRYEPQSRSYVSARKWSLTGVVQRFVQERT